MTMCLLSQGTKRHVEVPAAYDWLVPSCNVLVRPVVGTVPSPQGVINRHEPPNSRPPAPAHCRLPVAGLQMARAPQALLSA
mmetsp:Transcript_8812/g.14771  ORF Transcript_8812/g.14771 Transcript_8812/m.14771 type:complete len:81 (+) Transcript_8812:341-583(+)